MEFKSNFDLSKHWFEIFTDYSFGWESYINDINLRDYVMAAVSPLKPTKEKSLFSNLKFFEDNFIVQNHDFKGKGDLNSLESYIFKIEELAKGMKKYLGSKSEDFGKLFYSVIRYEPVIPISEAYLSEIQRIDGIISKINDYDHEVFKQFIEYLNVLKGCYENAYNNFDFKKPIESGIAKIYFSQSLDLLSDKEVVILKTGGIINFIDFHKSIDQRLELLKPKFSELVLLNDETKDINKLKYLDNVFNSNKKFVLNYFAGLKD